MKKKFNKINILLILILAVNLLLRAPSLFDPVSYGDECIYLTLGKAFNRGLVFYRDLHDNKPPLLYLIAALASGKLFWFKLITILWNTFNVYLIYLLGKKISQKNSPPLIAALIFVILSFFPEGRIANGEIYMIMPATLGVLFVLIALEKKKSIYFLTSGFLFSFAFLFKIPVIFDFIGLLIGVFIFPKINFNQYPNKFKLSLSKVKAGLLILIDKNLFLILFGFVFSNSSKHHLLQFKQCFQTLCSFRFNAKYWLFIFF